MTIFEKAYCDLKTQQQWQSTCLFTMHQKNPQGMFQNKTPVSSGKQTRNSTTERNLTMHCKCHTCHCKCFKTPCPKSTKSQTGLKGPTVPLPNKAKRHFPSFTAQAAAAFAATDWRQKISSNMLNVLFAFFPGSG